jgi:cell division protein FtsQ
VGTGGSAGRGRTWLRAIGVAAVVAGAVAGGLQAWRAVRESPAFRIRTIRFEGLGKATADELLALSPVKPGDHLLLADVPAMERALARHPWVRRLEIRRGWPPLLTVKVTERAAAALVELSGLYLVDDDGTPFKRAEPGDGLDLPVVTGIGRAAWVGRRAEAEPLLAGALALARAWREGARDAAAPLSEIHVDPGDGTTLYLGEEGLEVRLGSGDLDAKLSRLERILSTLRAEGKKAEVLHLDDRLHPNRVTVRLAGASPSPVVKVGAGSREPVGRP